MIRSQILSTPTFALQNRPKLDPSSLCSLVANDPVVCWLCIPLPCLNPLVGGTHLLPLVQNFWRCTARCWLVPLIWLSLLRFVCYLRSSSAILLCPPFQCLLIRSLAPCLRSPCPLWLFGSRSLSAPLGTWDAPLGTLSPLALSSLALCCPLDSFDRILRNLFCAPL